MATSVVVRAQAFRVDVFSASMMASLEKNPAKKGVPIKARLPKVIQVEVNGIVRCIPPIFRISCSSSRLWITEPEPRKSIALKKACVQMCKKAS